MGEAEDGSEGIVVHAQGFLGGAHGANEFRFMSTEVSRERPVNYEELAARVGEEKRRGGYLVWVVGPGAGALAGPRGLRVVHPERLRAGGAGRQRGRRARHRGGDLRHHAGHEQHRPAHRGRPRPPHARHQPGAGGRLHRAGGRDRAHQERHHARAGHAPRARTCSPGRSATTARCRASTATRSRRRTRCGSTPSRPPAPSSWPPRCTRSRSATCCRRSTSATAAPAPLMTICVDQTEFVVNKLKDRGTHQAYGVVTNAQDFMHVLRFYTERWEQAHAMTAASDTGWAAARRLRWRSSIAARRSGRRLGLQPPAARRPGMGHRGALAGWTATAGGSTPRATCWPSRARSAGSSRRRSRRSAAARSRRSPSCCRTPQRRIDDEQPPAAGAARELVRGRAADAPPR